MNKAEGLMPKDIFIGEYQLENLYGLKPIAKIPKENKELEFFLLNNEPTSIKELNSFGYRCDEFTNDHNGKHLIFSGCSYTWGTGLEIEEVWAKQLYNKINSEVGCSGYFNLGFPGSSLVNQIFDLFKYFNNFGNPEIIFLNITEPERFYAIQNNKILNSRYSEESIPLISLLYYQNYFMLEEYCKTNNIKLYSFSWNNPDKIESKQFFKNIKKQFKTFYQINFSLQHDYVQKNKINKGKYYGLSRDKIHLGSGHHEYWCNFIYERYLNDNTWN